MAHGPLTASVSRHRPRIACRSHMQQHPTAGTTRRLRSSPSARARTCAQQVVLGTRTPRVPQREPSSSPTNLYPWHAPTADAPSLETYGARSFGIAGVPRVPLKGATSLDREVDPDGCARDLLVASVKNYARHDRASPRFPSPPRHFVPASGPDFILRLLARYLHRTKRDLFWHAIVV